MGQKRNVVVTHHVNGQAICMIYELDGFPGMARSYLDRAIESCALVKLSIGTGSFVKYLSRNSRQEVEIGQLGSRFVRHTGGVHQAPERYKSYSPALSFFIDLGPS